MIQALRFGTDPVPCGMNVTQKTRPFSYVRVQEDLSTQTVRHLRTEPCYRLQHACNIKLEDFQRCESIRVGW